MTFKDTKKQLLEKMQAFEEIGNKFKTNSCPIEDLITAKKSVENALDEYEQTLGQLSDAEYDKEKNEGMRFHEEAKREHDQYIPDARLRGAKGRYIIDGNLERVAMFRYDIGEKWQDIVVKRRQN